MCVCVLISYALSFFLVRFSFNWQPHRTPNFSVLIITFPNLDYTHGRAHLTLRRSVKLFRLRWLLNQAHKLLHYSLGTHSNLQIYLRKPNQQIRQHIIELLVAHCAKQCKSNFQYCYDTNGLITNLSRQIKWNANLM